MGIDVRDFASFASGEDFQPAFRAALDNLVAQGGGELVIPKPSGTNTYWIGRREKFSGIDFAGVNVPITIRGEGRTPRIGVLPSRDSSGSPVPTGDFYMFHFHDTHSSISLENLCLFGNKDAFPVGQDEQTHLVQIRHARDVSFTNVWFEHSRGDGIKIVGDIGEDNLACERINITGCHFLHNLRGGVLFQRLARRIFLTHNPNERAATGRVSFTSTTLAGLAGS